VEITGTTSDPLAWNKAAWLTLGAPAVVLSVIAAGLFKTCGFRRSRPPIPI
jgi:hypothetical protein